MVNFSSFTLIVVVSLFYTEVDGDCIWYQQCGFDGYTYNMLNCLYTGPAKPFTDKKGLQQLLDTCYDLDIGSNSSTCCDSKLAHAMLLNLEVFKWLFDSCSSCYKTFVKNVCFMTCSPNQSNFLKVNNTKMNLKDQTVVTAIDYYMSKHYAQGMFDSCKNVKCPDKTCNTSLQGICGHANPCTPQAFFDHYGRSIFTPYIINYHISDVNPDKKMKPMNATAVPCSKPYKKGADVCECKDCPTSPKCHHHFK